MPLATSVSYYSTLTVATTTESERIETNLQPVPAGTDTTEIELK